jgi:hypothetical protein
MSTTRLKVLVTGGTSGLGLAMASAFETECPAASIDLFYPSRVLEDPVEGDEFRYHDLAHGSLPPLIHPPLRWSDDCPSVNRRAGSLEIDVLTAGPATASNRCAWNSIQGVAVFPSSVQPTSAFA